MPLAGSEVGTVARAASQRTSGRSTDAAVEVVADNRRARYDYFIEGSIEAGIVLLGTEIGSIRNGRVHLRDAYARVEHGEAWLVGCHIGPHVYGNRFNHEPLRKRKLLLHRHEIDELLRHARQGGRTLVPLRLYLKNGRAKVEIGLARGKHQYDKRAAIADRDRAREAARAVAARQR